jgi:hypothetical protein
MHVDSRSSVSVVVVLLVLLLALLQNHRWLALARLLPTPLAALLLAMALRCLF